MLIGGEGSAVHADAATLTICDLGGDASGAGLLASPYLSPGSLYVLCVAAHLIPLPRALTAAATVRAIPTDDSYAERVGEWLTLLQMGAPGAIVPVLTHCDLLLAPDSHPSPAALANAAAEHAKWLVSLIEKHQEALRPDAPRLRPPAAAGAPAASLAPPVVPCVCSSGSHGGPSLEALRLRLEALVIGSKEARLVPTIGQNPSRGVQIAASMLRALRDGRDPIASAARLGRW